MLKHSAAASGVATINYSQFIPDFISDKDDLAFYYDAGIFESYPEGGNSIRDLISGGKFASISGGTYSSANGGEIVLESGSFIQMPNDEMFDLGTGPKTILVSFVTTDTSKRNHILNKKGEGKGYNHNATGTNLTVSGSSETTLSLSADKQSVDPGELGFAMVSYESGGGSVVGELNYPLGTMNEEPSIVIQESSAGGEQGDVTNNLSLYIGRNQDGSDYANIKVQAIFGFNKWWTDITDFATTGERTTYRNRFTSSRA